MKYTIIILLLCIIVYLGYQLKGVWTNIKDIFDAMD